MPISTYCQNAFGPLISLAQIHIRHEKKTQVQAAEKHWPTGLNRCEKSLLRAIA